MLEILKKIKATKIYGISAIYIVAAAFAILTIFAIFKFSAQKEEITKKASKDNVELNQMQDSALSRQVWITTIENGVNTITLATDAQKLEMLRKSPEYQAKLEKALDNESKTPFMWHKIGVWFLAVLLSSLAVTLVMYLMTHINIKKEFAVHAVKMAPLLYIVNLITLTCFLIFGS